MEYYNETLKKTEKRDSNTMPQWAGSCWYYLRFCDPRNKKQAWSEEKERYWMPVDLYIGGQEHAVLHMLYARFWHKVLFDLGLVSTSEPFKCHRNQGMILSQSYRRPGGQYVTPEDVKKVNGDFIHEKSGDKLLVQFEKMSKSKLNGENPDDYVARYGADALRMYELFMGPFEKEKKWDTDHIQGTKRFIMRVFNFYNQTTLLDKPQNDCMLLVNKLVKDVDADYDRLLFNTAIAKMMDFINKYTKLNTHCKKSFKIFLKCLYPITPHIAEHIWQIMGNKSLIVNETFPTVDYDLIEKSQNESVTYILQVNGKLRAKNQFAKRFR